MDHKWGQPLEIQVKCKYCGGSGSLPSKQVWKTGSPVVFPEDCRDCKGTGIFTLSIPCEPTAGMLVEYQGEWYVTREYVNIDDKQWIIIGPVSNMTFVVSPNRTGIYPGVTPILPSPAQCNGVTWRDVIPCDDELEDTVTGETCRVWNTPAGSLNILGDGDVQLGWLDLGSDEDHENAELLLHCRKVLKQWKAQFDEGVQGCS